MEKKNLKIAKFITLEGIEGSGKSTVIKFLSKFLSKKNFSYKIFRDPGSTKVGEKIREILLDKKNKISPYTELLLYLAARTQLIEEKIKNSFLKYDFIICDRFFDSTLVYQGYALGIDITEKLVDMLSFKIIPDLTILLDTEPEEGLKRIKNKDRIESRPILFHKKLREGYLKLKEKYPQRIKIVKSKKLEDIYKDVEKILKEKFNI